jgi:preprotein translocase subunit SecE
MATDSLPAPDNFIQRATSWPVKVKNYFEELQMEMRRVTWPSWKQVRATTMVVIVAVFAFAAFFMVVDDICYSAVTKLTNAFSR